MNFLLRSRLGEALDATVRETRPLSGGDICQAYLVTLDDGHQVFVKIRVPAISGMFETEALGLLWLEDSESLRIPRVLARSDEFLALEFLRSGAPRVDFDQRLGQGLAALHRREESRFGWTRDNFIGSLPQNNEPCRTWAEFYAERRLRPLVEKARCSGLAPADWTRRFERLFEELPSRLPQEPPSRLHGDLWSGNLLVGPSGEPCLIDPSVYAGHREVDLAMMRLFGGFGAGVFHAYQRNYPLLPGHAERVALYQLYPMLVHLNLFGAGYASSVEQRLSAWEKE